MIVRTCFCFAVVTVGLFSCDFRLSADQPAAKPARSKQAKVSPDRTVVYKTVGDVALELHVFEPDDKFEKPRPGVVFFFGGGWVSGSPSHFYPQSDRLAELGMVAICADYRTASRHKTSPRECVQDGKSAMRYVRAHAKDFGIDPDRLAAGGGSAGGHVAAATATLSGLDEPGESTDVSCVPNALLLFNPVFDNGPDGWGHAKVKDYWKQISPMHNLSGATPPTLVMLGTEDKLIPVETGESFQAKMRELGRRCELKLYEGQGHGFFNKIKFDETLNDTIEFLKSIGYVGSD